MTGGVLAGGTSCRTGGSLQEVPPTGQGVLTGGASCKTGGSLHEVPLAGQGGSCWMYLLHCRGGPCMISILQGREVLE